MSHMLHNHKALITWQKRIEQHPQIFIPFNNCIILCQKSQMHFRTFAKLSIGQASSLHTKITTAPTKIHPPYRQPHGKQFRVTHTVVSTHSLYCLDQTSEEWLRGSRCEMPGEMQSVPLTWPLSLDAASLWRFGSLYLGEELQFLLFFFFPSKN